MRNAFPHLRRILWNTEGREPRAIPSRTCAGNLARSHRRSEESPYACGQSGYTQTIGIFTALAHTCGQPAASAPKPVHSFRFPHGRGKRRLASSPLREFSKKFILYFIQLNTIFIGKREYLRLAGPFPHRDTGISHSLAWPLRPDAPFPKASAPFGVSGLPACGAAGKTAWTA